MSPFVLICLFWIFAYKIFGVYSVYLKKRHSSPKYMLAYYAFKLYVMYHQYIKKRQKPLEISLELKLMDEYFRKHFKPKFVNHTIDNALDLLNKTRKTRNQFLEYTLAPINTDKINIESSNINDTKVVWVNKCNIKNGIIISFHGGAYVSGKASSCLPYLIPISENTNMAGLSVDYAISPERVLPYCVTQCYGIFKHVINELGVKPKNIALIGDSAGGSLVILLLQKIIKEMPDNIPGCGITMSSWDVPTEGDSYKYNEDKDALLDQKTGKIWAHFCVGNIDINGEWTNKNIDMTQTEFSYLDGKFNDMPPIFMSASEWECVIDDTYSVAKKCQNVTQYITKECGLHVLETLYYYDIKEAKDLIQNESQFILKNCK